MTRSWSSPRVATACALFVWSGAFWYIIATDRLAYYLAARTTWLAPLGAITLTAAALGRLATSRVSQRERATRRQLGNLVLLVIPAIVILALPPLTLGAYAVGRRPASLAGPSASTTGADVTTGDLSLINIFELSYTNELHLLASRAGATSSFTGFVSRDSAAAVDEFQLNRFMVSCCPGDAILISVRVVSAPPGDHKVDDWVRVTGKVYPISKSVVVDATDVQKVPQPKHPYLNQSR